MNHLDELNVLIDRASAIAGSDYRLAKLIGMTPQNVSNWRHGAASCSPENRALLASVAGLDPIAELARATVEKHEGTKKGDMLMRALGKSLLATGAAVASAGASAASIFSTIPAPAHLHEWLVSAFVTMCVMSNLCSGWPGYGVGGSPTGTAANARSCRRPKPLRGRPGPDRRSQLRTTNEKSARRRFFEQAIRPSS